MKLPHRRQFLHLAAGAAALPAVSRIARAQAYPSRPVRIDRRFRGRRRDRHHCAPDRAMAIGAARPAIHRREPAGRQGQYRHRGGRTRAPDGYTLLLVISANAAQRDALRQAQFQFHPRHRAGRWHHPRAPVMEVNPSFPAKTVPEFIAYAKANPGKINMASAGNGTPHMCRRTVQDDDRRQHGSCAVSRRRACADRSARRTGASHVRHLPPQSSTSGPASCAHWR